MNAIARKVAGGLRPCYALPFPEMRQAGTAALARIRPAPKGASMEAALDRRNDRMTGHDKPICHEKMTKK